LFAVWLAAQHPSHTVQYRPWNTGSEAYDAATTISTGTGPRTITLFNLAVSGSVPDQWLGSLFSPAIASLSPDLIIFNHGHNLTGLVAGVLRGRLLSATEQTSQAQPGVPIALLIQNPRRDDDLYAPIAAELRKIADQRGFDIIDVYSRFIAAGKPADWYADSVHPNAAGQAQFLAVTQERWLTNRGASDIGRPSWLDALGDNLLTNGDFSAFASAVPDGWTLSGNGVLTKDTTVTDGPAPYSVKIVNGSTATTLLQNITGSAALALRGKTVTLVTRYRIDAGGNANAGRNRVFSNETGAVLTAANVGHIANDAFKYSIVSGVLIGADATIIGAYVSAHSTGGSVGTIYIDSVGLYEGEVPYGI
jgi:hypothetical protein